MPTGITNAGGLAVQKKSGTLTTNSSGEFSFDVGFEPDVFIVWPDKQPTSENIETQLVYNFAEMKKPSYGNEAMASTSTGFYLITELSRAGNVVSGTILDYGFDLSNTPVRNKSLECVAIKYT